MKEIFIQRENSLLKIAVKDNGLLTECFVSEHSVNPCIGEIYKGKIKNIIPGTNSIFIDMGLDKEGYMYYSNDLKKENLKKGDDVLVEILKEPIGNKGAKVASKPNLVGQYMVLNIGGEGIEFSKRITSNEEKERLSKIITAVDGFGLLFRTDSVKASDNELIDEFEYLYNQGIKLLKELKYSTRLGKVYGDNAFLTNVIRERIKKKTSIITNNKDDFNLITELISNNKEVKVDLFENYRSLFDYYSINKEILKLRHNKVSLPCGGYIVIEKTEAMYVVDVNSGKYTSGKNFDKTILDTNLEAAEEIGRQIGLRNLSGIILIDFIDMRDKSQKSIVLNKLKESLINDKGNVKVFPFTELDLVQIARKRRGKSVYEYLEEECKYCQANGRVIKLSFILELIKDEILKCEKENSIDSFYIQLDRNYKEEIEGDLFNFFKSVNALDKEIYINYIDGLEGYKVEPLIFSNQKENLQKYKKIPYEKYE